MAAPTVRSVGAVASGVGAITPGLPAGTVAGDLLVMFLETYNQAITVSGWTQAPSSPQSRTTDTRLTIFYKIAVGSDTRTTSDSGDHQVGRIIGITAGTFNAASPFNASAGWTASATGSHLLPTATTTVDDCLILSAIAIGWDASTANRFTSWTNAAQASLTELIDNGTTSGNGGVIGVATGVRALAGSYGYTQVAVASSLYGAAMITLAVAPVAGVGTWFGATSLTEAASVVTAGTPTKFAASASTETLSRVTAGAKTTFSSATSTETLSVTTSGAIGHFGATDSAYTAEITTNSTRIATGASVTPLAATITTAGTRTTTSATSTTETLSVETAGTRTGGISSSSTFSFSATTAGTSTAIGRAAGEFAFEATTAGTPTKFASLISGLFPGPDTYPGSTTYPGYVFLPAVDRDFGFSATTTGRLGAKSSASLTETLDVYTFGVSAIPPAATWSSSASASFTLSVATVATRTTASSTSSVYTLGITLIWSPGSSSTYTFHATTAGRPTKFAATAAVYVFVETTKGNRFWVPADLDTMTLTPEYAAALTLASTSPGGLTLTPLSPGSMTATTADDDTLTLTPA